LAAGTAAGGGSGSRRKWPWRKGTDPEVGSPVGSIVGVSQLAGHTRRQLTTDGIRRGRRGALDRSRREDRGPGSETDPRGRGGLLPCPLTVRRARGCRGRSGRQQHVHACTELLARGPWPPAGGWRMRGRGGAARRDRRRGEEDDDDPNPAVGLGWAWMLLGFGYIYWKKDRQNSLFISKGLVDPVSHCSEF